MTYTPTDRPGDSQWTSLGSSAQRFGRACSAAAVPLAAMTFMLGGCASGGQKMTQSGFLQDYSKVKPRPGDKDALIFIQDGFQAATYTKVVIDPVEWRASARTDGDEQKLEADFHERLTKTLSAHFQIVDAPKQGQDVGPGVLRVRSAITNTRKAIWYLNVATMAGSAALGGIPLPPVSAGGASEELSVSDAQTGAELIDIVTFTNGRPWNIKGRFVAYGHASLAFQKAAELLGRLVQAEPVRQSVLDPIIPAALTGRACNSAAGRRLRVDYGGPAEAPQPRQARPAGELKAAVDALASPCAIAWSLG